MADSTPQSLADALATIIDGLARTGYICNRQTAIAVHLAAHLGKPILVEGPAGVGKTELAKAVAEMRGLPLIRMQCYEGLDESKALYEWKYGKQLLYTQILKDRLGASLADAPDLASAMERLAGVGDVFFSEQFLEARPLLRALQEEHGAVLLIDEVDKSDHEFEAFLLELLSDFQVTIPEIGTISARTQPLVILTSNNIRDLGDALKRRCLYLRLDFPDQRLEEKIVAARVPEISATLRRQLVSFVQQLRQMDLKKLPSVSETIDWARALLLLHVSELGHDIVESTLNILLKYEADIESAQRQAGAAIAKAKTGMPVG